MVAVTITYNGKVVSGSGKQATQVVVGQQVSLTGSPAGGTWSVGGKNFGQYSNYPSSGPTQTNQSANPVQFFWAAGGSASVTYTAGGSTATAAFQIGAPTMGTPSLAPAQTTIQSGYITVPVVITAEVSQQPPGYTGALSAWLQEVNSDAINIITPSGTGASCNVVGNLPDLDSGAPYPYATAGVLTDQPRLLLGTPGSTSGWPSNTTLVQVTKSFTAQVLWTPQVANAIPVPVQNVNWGWTAFAGWSGGAWSVYGANSSVAITSSTAPQTYVTWTPPAISNPPSYTCVLVQ